MITFMTTKYIKFFVIFTLLFIIFESILFKKFNPPLAQLQLYSNCKSLNNTNVRKFVVMSVNLDSNLDFYLFYLPIICLSWRKLVDFEPVILGVIDKNTQSSKLTNKTLEFLKLINVTIIYVESVPHYEKMTGMLSRLLIGAINSSIINENDFVFTSDSDLIPFRKEYFRITDYESIILLDAFRFGKFRYKKEFYSMYSMQYIGMKKCLWRSIMRLRENELTLDGRSILKLVKNLYGSSNVKKNADIWRGDTSWWLDQKLVSIHIDNYLKFNKDQTVVRQPYDGLKLDRIYSDKKWLHTFEKEYDSIIDAHLFHDNYFKKIEFIKMIMNRQLDKEMIKILNKYIGEFVLVKNQLTSNILNRINDH